MKILLYISLIILFTIISQAHENGLNPINQPDVKGGYRKCTVLQYNYKNGVFDSNKVKIREIIQYDENGNILEHYDFLVFDYPRLIINYIYHTNCFIKIETLMNVDGIIKKYYFSEYNLNGDLVSYINLDSALNFEYQLAIDIDESELFNRQFSFDKNNKIISSKLTKLNAEGKTILDQTFDRTNNLKVQITIEYDSSGNMIEYRDGIDSNFTSKLVLKYDKNGNIIEDISYNSKNDTSHHKIYFTNLTENYIESIDLKDYRMGRKSRMYRDNKGNIIKWLFYNEKDEIESIQYGYFDSENREIGHTILENGSIYHKVTREYDIYGNLLNVSYYDSNDKVNQEIIYLYEL